MILVRRTPLGMVRWGGGGGGGPFRMRYHYARISKPSRKRGGRVGRRQIVLARAGKGVEPCEAGMGVCVCAPVALGVWPLAFRGVIRASAARPRDIERTGAAGAGRRRTARDKPVTICAIEQGSSGLRRRCGNSKTRDEI